MMKEKKTVKTIVFLTETMSSQLEDIATSTGVTKQDLIRTYISTGLFSQKKAEEFMRDFIQLKGELNV